MRYECHCSGHRSLSFAFGPCGFDVGICVRGVLVCFWRAVVWALNGVTWCQIVTGCVCILVYFCKSGWGGFIYFPGVVGVVLWYESRP